MVPGTMDGGLTGLTTAAGMMLPGAGAGAPPAPTSTSVSPSVPLPGGQHGAATLAVAVTLTTHSGRDVSPPPSPVAVAVPPRGRPPMDLPPDLMALVVDLHASLAAQRQALQAARG